MYICDDCGKAFETPHLYREDMNGEGAYDEFAESPCCHESFSEAKDCPMCGEPMSDTQDVCDKCQAEIDEKIFELEKELDIGDRYTFAQTLEKWIERFW